MGATKQEAKKTALDSALLTELLKVCSGADTKDAVLDELARLAREDKERALEKIFDLAPEHPRAAKLRDGFVKEGFYLERDGSQVACFIRLATEGVASATRALIKLADEGDKKAFDWAKKLYENDHDSRSVVSSSESTLAKSMSGPKRLLSAFVLQRDMESHRKRLLSDEPTELERVLVDRIVYCHAVVNSYETGYSQAGSMSLPQADFQQRTIDRAHRRLLTAVETLAKVRRLQLVPTLQVNIAQKQLNVAANASSVSGCLPGGGAEPEGGLERKGTVLAGQEGKKIRQGEHAPV